MRWSTVVLAHISSPVTGEMGIPLCGSWPQRFPPAAHLLTSLGCISPGGGSSPLCVLVRSPVCAVLARALLLTSLWAWAFGLLVPGPGGAQWTRRVLVLEPMAPGTPAGEGGACSCRPRNSSRTPLWRGPSQRPGRVSGQTGARLTSRPLCSREAPGPHLSPPSAAPRAAAVQAQKAKQAVFLPYLTPVSSAP